jgi:hypothetical protein
MKKQTEYTFNEAKKAAIKMLSVLANFAESLHDRLLDKALLEWAIVLRTLEARIKKASGRCLSDSEIKLVWGFGQELIRGNPDLTFQLSQFWNLYDEVLKMLRVTKSSPGYAPQGVINLLRSRINLADKLAENIVSAARSQISNVLSPAALLLVHIVRTETIEYALLKQLEDATKKHSLESKYDVKSICSVLSKVPKGPEWRTDVRAIRDATAHGHFRIHLLKNDWAIDFDNNKDGYSFQKNFSRNEFTRFFDMHTLLYKLQLHLLVILELLPILATHLHEQP